jgi:hypothetical protein
MFPLRLSTILALWFVAMSLCDATTILNCVGDSITAGVGVSGPLVAIQSYPARLQQLVGTNYIVGNKGLSRNDSIGLTIWKSSPFRNQLIRND